ncbi:GldG family protein [bacterium]|nr:GldG family protein [bacterium]
MVGLNPDHDNIRDIYMDSNPSEKIRQSKNAIPKLIGSVGAIALVLGLIIIAISDSVNVFTLGLSGLGLLLLLVFVAIDFKKVKAFMSSRETVYSANMTIVFLALFGILVIVNSVSSNHYVTIDLTKNSDNTLSEQTRKILKDVSSTKRNIQITAFLRNDSPRKMPCLALLERFSHFAPTLKYGCIDYEIKKKLAIEKGIDRPCLLLESDGMSQISNDFDERSVTSALLKLLHPDQKVIGLLAGHGEFKPQGTGGRSLSQLVAYLEKENFIVKPLNIASTGNIPLEISLVVIAAPNRPVNEREIAALTDFSRRGGSIALFLEPFSNHGLDSFLGKIGVEDNDDMLIDRTENYFQEETTPVLKTYMHHPITAGFLEKQMEEGGFVGGLIVPTATSFKILDKLPQELSVEPLALSSKESWGETDSTIVELNPEEDNVGPVNVAVVSTINFPMNEEDGTESVTSRCVVVGDADLLTDASLKEGSNFDFVLNSINWLVEEETMIAERVRIAEDRKIDLEPSQIKAMQVINLFIPLFIAAIGLFMWIRRR